MKGYVKALKLSMWQTYHAREELFVDYRSQIVPIRDRPTGAIF